MDHRMLISIRVALVTRTTIIITTFNSQFERVTTENSEIEIFWTLVPAAILWFIGAPSIKTLFLSEDIIYPILTFKATGHQWYWSYEYTDLKEIQFDAFIENNRKIRLLLTRNHLILPSQTNIRALVTSEDVIHSWAIPSIGVKADAIPGRLNQSFIFIIRNGLFSGQCSELCGAGHSFIPILISSIPKEEFSESIKHI
jgi:cytochrome c oxidase subunit 2